MLPVKKCFPVSPFLLDPLSETGSHVGQRERPNGRGSPRLSDLAGQSSDASAGPNHRSEQRAADVPPAVSVEPDESTAVDLGGAHRGAVRCAMGGIEMKGT